MILKFSKKCSLTQFDILILIGISIMVSAIGSTPTFSPFPTANAAASKGVSTADIQAQIARYRQELADCVNCSSSKTLQGKANIQALTDKISVLETRLQDNTTTHSANQSTTVNLNKASDNATNVNATETYVKNKGSAESATILKSSDSHVGRFVDVYV